MTIFVDARIPVLFAPVAESGPGDLLLTEADLSGAPGHSAGCGCCAPRGALAQALHRLFLARVRGEVAFFRRVVVTAPAAGLREALTGDTFLAGRYRAEG